MTASARAASYDKLVNSISNADLVTVKQDEVVQISSSLANMMTLIQSDVSSSSEMMTSIASAVTTLSVGSSSNKLSLQDGTVNLS